MGKEVTRTRELAMRQSSPLHVIYSHISEKYGSPQEGGLPSDTKFWFLYEFPGVSQEESASLYTTWVHWNKKKEEMSITTTPTRFEPFKPWDGMSNFFPELTENVKIFFDGNWKAGLLLPFSPVGGPATRLCPGHQIILECAGGNERLLKKSFDKVHCCALQALLLTSPIFISIARTGNIPNGVEQIELLEAEIERRGGLSNLSSASSANLPTLLQ